MLSKIGIKSNLIQILALTEMQIKLKMRYKFHLILNYINPLITVLLPLIIMGSFFDYNNNFGPWTRENYLIFMFMAYDIILLKGLIDRFPNEIANEKYWKTLTALIIAPFNRINLLFGFFISQLLLISIPFVLFLILCYFVFPISFITLLMVLLIFFLIAIIFSGIGLFLGVFAISNENFWYIFGFLFNIVFWFSCVIYPFEIFPSFMQNILSLNPLYYIFTFLRLVWIENDFFFSMYAHNQAFLLLITSSIIVPSFGIYIFNKIYKKFGITGY